MGLFFASHSRTFISCFTYDTLLLYIVQIIVIEQQLLELCDGMTARSLLQAHHLNMHLTDQAMALLPTW